MARIAYIDACRIRMHHLQSRIGRVQSQLQFLALRAIQLSALQTLKSGHLPLRHGILSLLLDFARLGSVGVNYTNSLTGSSLAFSGQPATKQ
jgi:hypothetical protein